MVMIEEESFSLEEHIFPVLEAAGKSPVWHSSDGGLNEAIICDGNYISICNSNELYIEGQNTLIALFLLKEVKSKEEEITIHFYKARE